MTLSRVSPIFLCKIALFVPSLKCLKVWGLKGFSAIFHSFFLEHCCWTSDILLNSFFFIKSVAEFFMTANFSRSYYQLSQSSLFYGACFVSRKLLTLCLKTLKMCHSNCSVLDLFHSYIFRMSFNLTGRSCSVFGCRLMLDVTTLVIFACSFISFIHTEDVVLSTVYGDVRGEILEVREAFLTSFIATQY